MIELTIAQESELRRMLGRRVLAKLHTGAALVVHHQVYNSVVVIDTDGNISSLSRYLAVLDQRKELRGE